MKITDLIFELEGYLSKHGDIEVYVNSHENGFVEVVEEVEVLDTDKKVFVDGMVSKKGILIGY